MPSPSRLFAAADRKGDRRQRRRRGRGRLARTRCDFGAPRSAGREGRLAAGRRCRARLAPDLAGPQAGAHRPARGRAGAGAADPHRRLAAAGTASPAAPTVPRCRSASWSSRSISHRAEIGAPVLGTAAVLSLDGSARRALAAMRPTPTRGAPRWTAAGIRCDAKRHQERIDAKLDVDRAGAGLIAQLGQARRISARCGSTPSVAGPRERARDRDAQLEAGPLTADARRNRRPRGQALDLQVNASAPAMQPAPDVSWRHPAAGAGAGPVHEAGRDRASQVTELAAAGAEVRQLAADLAGNAGQVSLRAVADGRAHTGPRPDLLAARRSRSTRHARLDDRRGPSPSTSRHPLLSAKGQARTAGTPEVDADIALARLAPFAAIGGVDLQGSTALHVHATCRTGPPTSTADGTISITGGLAPCRGWSARAPSSGSPPQMHGAGPDGQPAGLWRAGRCGSRRRAAGRRPAECRCDRGG